MNGNPNNQVLNEETFLTVSASLIGAYIQYMLDNTKKIIGDDEFSNLPLCYRYFEGLIEYLVDENVNLELKTLDSIKRVLYETMQAVAAFLGY